MNKSKINVVLSNDGYILPKVSENRTRKKWIQYGLFENDDYFSYITKRYQTSQTQQSVVDGVTQLLYGLGLKSKDPIVEVELARLTEPEEIKRLIQDYKLYGIMAIQCVFSPDRSSIDGFYHIPVDTLRSEKCDDNGDIHGYWYSPDWTNTRIEPTYIPALGESDYENDVQILYVKRYTPGMYYYALPDWYSCLQYCAVEEEISNLHISNIRNGFMPGAMINFNSGQPPEEEMAMIEGAIASKFSGTSNAGRFILSWNESKEDAATIDVIQTANLHDNYRFLSEEAKDKIMLANRVTSQLLFGIKTASGFSSNADELKTSYDVMMKMVIQPMQNEILKAFTKVLEVAGYPNSQLYFEQLVPWEVESELIDEVGEAKAEEITDSNEEVTVDNENPIGNE